jgi:hypothetical protein
MPVAKIGRRARWDCGGWLLARAARAGWRVAKARDGVGAFVTLLAGVSLSKLACPLPLGSSEA